MSELTASVSLWLPVGRSNYYSTTANNWLLKRGTVDGSISATSSELDVPGYRPRLQVSVLRRVLEVLPVSFGYDRMGTCVFGEGDDLKRPVTVTMTLRPKPQTEQLPESPERRANLPLIAAGIHEVTCQVNEHGSYTFTAKARFDADTALNEALSAHVREVFGGRYSLDRQGNHLTGGVADNAGGTAVRLYQGLDTGSSYAEERPRGILTFFQLNTLAEGLFNESLSPAVFFEQNDDLDRYLATAGQRRGSLTLIREMCEVIDLIKVDDLDASTPEGLATALRVFLDATGREVLQKLKWSVESVRRSLLDESVGMLHRQSKLIQLDLGALGKEWIPELAVGASESQLRGYVMLAAAKLPLVANVHDIAQLTKEHVSHVAEVAKSHAVPHQSSHGGAAGMPGGHATPNPTETLRDHVKKLEIEIRHWNALLGALRGNVHGLEQAIEHAWRENLLYEQRAVRSEQEAIAEITRSRAGRPSSERADLNAYNIITLLFTIAAVLIAIREGDILDSDAVSSDWHTWVRALTPIAVVTVIFTLVVPFSRRLRRTAREKKGQSATYPYEFAFRLEEAADPGKVYRYLSNRKPRKVRSGTLKGLTLTSRGGGRIERVSQHRALIKIHSIATFKVGHIARRHFARFEIVKEILAHKVSGKPSFMIIQCRMFGDSPRALEPGEILALVSSVLADVGTRLTGVDIQRGDKEGIEVEDVLSLISPLFSAPKGAGGVAPMQEDGDEPTTVHIPSQGAEAPAP